MRTIRGPDAVRVLKLGSSKSDEGIGVVTVAMRRRKGPTIERDSLSKRRSLRGGAGSDTGRISQINRKTQQFNPIDRSIDFSCLFCFCLARPRALLPR